MPYRTDIPGQVSHFQLRAIEQVASLIPENGHAVEVGSLFGSSSYAWGASCHPSVTVHCIDPWEGNQGVRVMEERFNIKYSIEQFEEYTKELKTIRALKGYSPTDFMSWDQPLDLYYEDAVHTDPILSRNVEFWTSHLNPNGILCGDDYRPRFPDVVRVAHECAERLNRELITVDHFWCLLPSEAVCPGAEKVAAELKNLAKEAKESHENKGLMLRIGPNGPIERPAPGEALKINGRIYIDSLNPWPETPRGPLKVGARITTETEPDNEIVAAIVTLETDQLLYDQPENFSCFVQPGALPDEMYRVVFDVYSDQHGWMLHTSTANARAPLVRVGDPTVLAAPTLTNLDEGGNSDLVRPGDRLSFGLAGKVRNFTCEGWIDPEDHHRWTYADRSELSIPLNLQAFSDWPAYLLYFEVKPFVVAKKVAHQSLAVRVNGEPRLETRISGPDRVAVRIPRSVLTKRPTLDLEFIHPDYKRPMDFIEGSTDKKPVAFAFQTMQFIPLFETG